MSDLASCELMNFSLWDPPDVVVGRVGSLLHEEQSDPLEELVAGDSRHSQVEEQPVQHRQWDEVHWTEERRELQNQWKWNLQQLTSSVSFLLFLMNYQPG